MNAFEQEEYYRELHRIEVKWVNPENVPDEEDRLKRTNIIRTRAHNLFLRCHVPEGMGSLYTDKDRLPDPLAFEAALAEATDEEIDTMTDKSGRYLFGPTGTCKTWCAIEYAERYIKEGSDIYWWTAYDLKQKLFALRNDADEKERFVAWLSDLECPLFIDDLGHHVSESFLEVLRVILENRSYGAIIVTAQYSLEEFVERCHEKGMGRLAEAIARRLYEGCKRIEFKRERKVADTVPTKTKPVPASSAKPSDNNEAPAL